MKKATKVVRENQGQRDEKREGRRKTASVRQVGLLRARLPDAVDPVCVRVCACDTYRMSVKLFCLLFDILV